MSSAKLLNIALVGNPNSGKSSLFNHLTGLNQKIGNFPGVTVDKKIGTCKIDEYTSAEIIDLPGTYSLYPKSLDEQVVLDFLNNPKDPNYPDIVVVIADASNLKRNLLLFTQIADLGFPTILALNMLDMAVKSGLKIDIETLKKELKVPVVSINGRSGAGINTLKNTIASPLPPQEHAFLKTADFAPQVIKEIREKIKIQNDYLALLLAHQYRKNIKSLSTEQKKIIESINTKHGFQSVVLQIKETTSRYEFLDSLIKNTISRIGNTPKENISNKIDRIVTHKWGGYVIFFCLLFIIFQAIFAWATVPMELIDEGFAALNAFLKEKLPAGALTDLLTDGLIAGLGGVIMFVPQIMILFTFISILEESGYMSRVMFMMDKIMRKFGMNGRSVVPLISGVACAVPAIMATRSIDNWKDRIITIFVTPLMSCSARIPVFTILISLVVPNKMVLGFLSLQGFALMGLYLVGFLAAIISGYVMHLLLKSRQKSYFIMEFPSYKMPRWKNVGITILEKVKAFVFQAGKVIIAISIVLWVLASYGPAGRMQQAADQAREEGTRLHRSEEEIVHTIDAKKLEHSYAGTFGKVLEPAIRPLGFDWKIGIALITSFAAREVFIGTMSTIYSVGNDDVSTLQKKMREEKNPLTGGPMYTPALAFSLLIFYLFAMQCMSTLAVTYRETKGWKWPVLQFVYMTGLAYAASLVVYQVMK
jgi:ferrous iron transport protein B